MGSSVDLLEPKIEQLKVIIFDLDYTLWPFYVDSSYSPPFKKSGKKVVDSRNKNVPYYNEVPEILEKLKSLGYELAIASRTGATDEAEDLLRLFNWNQYFTYKQIYPGCKTTHIGRILKDSATQPSQLLFFDDETRNIRDLSAIGVCSILVHKGVNIKVVQQGLKTFLEQHQINGQ